MNSLGEALAGLARGSREPDSVDDAFATAAAEVDASLRARGGESAHELLELARSAFGSGELPLMRAWLTALYYAKRAPDHHAGADATARKHAPTRAWCLAEFDKLRAAHPPPAKLDPIYLEVVDNLNAAIGAGAVLEPRSKRTVRNYVEGRNRENR